MLTVDIVNSTVRVGFEANVKYVEKYLHGKGLDMGCGSCPLLRDDCVHIDMSPQPVCVDYVGESNFIHGNVTNYKANANDYDYVFSSHMLEDLPSRESIIDCLNHWVSFLKDGGHIALLLPDMQGGRYATVEEGGNCSHKVNVGRELFESIEPDLKGLRLVQIDTIPHDTSETIDVVFQKEKV